MELSKFYKIFFFWPPESEKISASHKQEANNFFEVGLVLIFRYQQRKNTPLLGFRIIPSIVYSITKILLKVFQVLGLTLDNSPVNIYLFKVNDRNSRKYA